MYTKKTKKKESHQAAMRMRKTCVWKPKRDSDIAVVSSLAEVVNSSEPDKWHTTLGKEKSEVINIDQNTISFARILFIKCMSRKKNSYTLFVGMKISITNMENSVKFPKNLPYDPATWLLVYSQNKWDISSIYPHMFIADYSYEISLSAHQQMNE
jgi:hypothetical protein